jgi:hypothetical protein
VPLYVSVLVDFHISASKVKPVYYIAFWTLLQFIYALIDPYIAVWAHLGGFFTGLALTTLLASRSRIRELHEKIARGSYRGVSPSSEDLENSRLGFMTRGFVVLVAILFIILVGAAYVKSSSYIDRYYTIYFAWCIEKVECIYVGGVYVNVDPNEIPHHFSLYDSHIIPRRVHYDQGVERDRGDLTS